MSIPYALDPLGTTDERVPAGYKKLSYLQSRNNGAQSLSTGIMPSAALRWVCEFQTADYTGTVWSNGAYNSAIQPARRTMFSETDDRLFYRARMYDELDDDVWSIPAKTRVIGDINYPAGYKALNNQRVYVNGTYYADAYIDLFIRRGQNSSAILRRGSVRVFKSDIYINGVLAQKLRPALDPNGRPCMYDFVSKRPFYNDGSGEFLYA